MRCKSIFVTALCCALPSLAVSTDSTSSSSRWRHVPEAGQRRAYQIESHGSTQAALGDWAKSLFGTSADAVDPKEMSKKFSFDITGEIHTRVLAHTNGTRRVAMRFSKLTYAIDHVTDDPSSLFTAPFIVEISDRGVFNDFHFVVGMPPRIASQLRALVESMQIVLPDNEVGEWQSVEPSSQGQAFVHYEPVVATAKNTLAFRRVLVGANQTNFPHSDEASTPLAFSSRVSSSVGIATFAVDGSGLVELEYHDQLNPVHSGSTLGERDVQFKATLLPDIIDNKLPTSVSSAEVALADPLVARAAFSYVPASARAQLINETVDTVVQRLIAADSKQMSQAVFLLKYFIRANPHVSRDITHRFNALPITEQNVRAIGFAMAAIASAGHAEAQAAMVEALTASGFTELFRQQTARATLSVAMPDPSLVRATWSYRQQLPRSGKGWKDQLAIITNLYGAQGGVEHGVRQNTEEVVRTLSNELQRASGSHEALMALTALGNVGDLRLVLPVVEPYFLHSDVAFRRRAFHAFQKAQGEDAFTSFQTHFSAQDGADVRLFASSIAEVMSETHGRNAWAHAQLIESADETIRQRAVSMLGNSIKHFPENEAFLRSRLDVEKDSEVRMAIYRFIAPVVTGGVR